MKLLETVTPDMLPTKLTEFNSVFLSPDGKTVVNVLMYHPRGTMKVWDIQEGKFLYTLKGHEHWIRYVVFSPDSRIMASGGVDIAISLWDVKTGRSLGILEEMGWTLSLAFPPDGEKLAAGILDGNVIIWDVKTGKRLRTLKTSAEHPNQVYRRRPEQALSESE